VLIIIKAAHFLQTVNLMSESENFGDIVRLIIGKKKKLFHLFFRKKKLSQINYNGKN
jgi:hypothetical protein